MSVSSVSVEEMPNRDVHSKLAAHPAWNDKTAKEER